LKKLFTVYLDKGKAKVESHPATKRILNLQEFAVIDKALWDIANIYTAVLARRSK